MLYHHGGGYLYMEVTRHFIALLTQTLGIRIFAPHYRLTPPAPSAARRRTTELSLSFESRCCLQHN